MFFSLERMNAVYLTAITLMMAACGQNPNAKKLDTATEGTIHISVDETYKPLIDSEIKVFQSLYPKAHIIPTYKPEADCFKDLLNDSARLVIVTRDFNQQERDYFKQIKITPNSLLLAWDALALVVNKDNPDSVLNMEQVRGIMDGTNKDRKWQLVFDNANSSTVRYIMDSINKGKPLPTNTMAAKTNPEVVDYVTKNKDAIGVIGVSWISDPNDSLSMAFTREVSVVRLRADNGSEFVKPYQAYIGIGTYPLKRGFFYCLKEPYHGLGSGFATFLGSYEGQLVMKQFRLFPARLNVVFREANLK
ncbi:phosphate ABC transporter substrate-binding protein, PhoT family [Chitinophaga ginsengisegetis]|uniref:Phosphate ABC transporter substrate-binding protein, PhoT family n=1 Tax=Chitinophaga ginsengisegetis TaxID=393003 RepID=A0A1T5NNB9_9BACT|nr:substrate-binding domain-containing protein [Chitinophaga ginsengisegetis]MDR6565371.1 phosphate transport system substrate-binding protein [Chitinophaga ginsengisegetis]MDR6645099.1 phosphate transport system substrate-binding protein [Chitinophaga ginsengisegetis]MDR6652309.1 phosphate transport system substrate-binding protein [Chitinophaga ginsengisegetis]SKD01619.1 phosphate ABC transporter substrate-binding protein, PhoT family [Chitinophaga ginsengisegetis]